METGRTKDGGFVIKQTATSPWVEVDEETYTTAKQSRIERGVRSLGDALQDTAGFLIGTDPNMIAMRAITGSQMQTPTERMGQQLMEGNDARQAARMRIDPVAEMSGMAAEALMPTPPVAGLASKGRQVMRTERMADRVTQRIQQRGSEIAGDTARTATPPVDDGRMLAGMLEPQELDNISQTYDVGKLYTRGDKAALTARNADEFDSATALREREELLRTDILGDRLAGRGNSINDIRGNAQRAATRIVMDELGSTDVGLLTRATFENARDTISAKFDDFAEQAGNLRLNRDDLRKINRAVEEAGANDASIVGKQADRLMADLTQTQRDDIGQLAEGVLPKDRARQLRNDLRDQITRSSKRGQFERSASLGEVLDVLDEIIERQTDEVGGAMETIQEARRQWRIIKSLERSSSTTTPSGEINVRSFLNAYDRGGVNRARTDDLLVRQMETLRFLQDKVVPSSGTAERILAQSSKLIGGAAATGAGVGVLNALNN